MFITASPAASVAGREPDAIHGATEPQLQTAAGRAEAEVHDSVEDTDSTSVASTIQKMKMMKATADLSPEEEQTMTTLDLRQCSLYYALIKFLLRPHSTTSSLCFFEHVQNSSTSSTRMETIPHPYRFVLHSLYDVQVLTASIRGENVAECDGGLSSCYSVIPTID